MEFTTSVGGMVEVGLEVVVEVLVELVVATELVEVLVVVDCWVASSPEQAESAVAVKTDRVTITRVRGRNFVRLLSIETIVADAARVLRHNRRMSLQTEIAASHLETLIERLTGVHKATPDAEGDYSVHFRGATFMSRIDGGETPICRVYAIISDGVEKTTELLEALNAINSRLTFLRIIWVHNQILLEGNHLALTMDEAEFTAICDDIAGAANAFGDRLVADFGGTSRFKEYQGSEYLKVREGHGPIYL